MAKKEKEVKKEEEVKTNEIGEKFVNEPTAPKKE